MKKISNSMICCWFLLIAFLPAEETGCNRSGIKGHLYRVSGNQMPSPGEPRPAPEGMKTTLYIYELTNTSQVSRDGGSPFYRSVSTKPVREIESGDDGSFEVKLNPGQYSLFVKKGDLFYANIYDANNNIYPVEVIKGKMTVVDFRVDYDAAY